MWRRWTSVALLLCSSCFARSGFEAPSGARPLGSVLPARQVVAPSAQVGSIEVKPPAAPANTSFALGVQFVAPSAAAGWTVRWDWTSDGTWDTAALPAVDAFAHTYATPGTYEVTAEVQTSAGQQTDLFADVRVTSTQQPPVVVGSSGTNAPGPSTEATLASAITQASAASDGQVVVLQGPATIVLDAPLPPLDGAAPTTLLGDGTVVIDGSAVTGPCLTASSNGNQIEGITFRGCSNTAVELDGDGCTVANDRFENNGTGVAVRGANNTIGPGNVFVDQTQTALDISGVTLVDDNRFSGNATVALLMNNASGSTIVGNAIDHNGMGIQACGNTDQLVIAFNTFASNSDDALMLPASATNTSFLNNIVAGQGSWGIQATSANFAALDFDTFFDNARGPCKSCDSLGGNSQITDPLFVDASTGDYRLAATSPCVDSGTNLDFDRNGPAPGLYNGAGPDRGAYER